jgi:hypothetical protein
MRVGHQPQDREAVGLEIPSTLPAIAIGDRMRRRTFMSLLTGAAAHAP